MNEVEFENYLSKILSHSRNYKQELLDSVKGYKYVVFYGVGAIFSSILTSTNDIGIKVDYCCDANESKWGKSFCGIECISPNQLMEMKSECIVFVTVGEYPPILSDFRAKGIACSKILFKYDFEIHDYLKNENLEEIKEKICKVRVFLTDTRSIDVYDSIIRRVLDPDSEENPMLSVKEDNQYFSLAPDLLSNKEQFVDVGAYDGDSINSFLKASNGQFDKIYAFEMDKNNFDKLNLNMDKLPQRDNIKTYNIGAWDAEAEISYNSDLTQSTLGSGDCVATVKPLDTVLENEKVSFVKMDIEGAELNALKGLQKTIRSQKPKLAICTYHDFSHLWEIPLYMKELVPEYKIYFRHYTNLEYETVCFAVNESV